MTSKPEYHEKKKNNCKQHFISWIEYFFLEILRRIEKHGTIFCEQELWIVITIRFTLKSRLPSMEFIIKLFFVAILCLKFTNYHIVLNLSALEFVMKLNLHGNNLPSFLRKSHLIEWKYFKKNYSSMVKWRWNFKWLKKEWKLN